MALEPIKKEEKPAKGVKRFNKKAPRNVKVPPALGEAGEKVAKVVSKVTLFGAVIVIMIVFSLFLIISTVMFSTNASNQIANNDTTQAKLSGDLKQLKDRQTKTVSQLQKETYSAAIPGREVAKLQNKYQAITKQGAGDNVDEQVRQNSADLRTYFDENNTSASAPWYTIAGVDNAGKEVKTNAVWEFLTIYNTVEHKIDGLWVCKADGKDPVIAYARATYNVDNKKFSNWSKKVLSTADQYTFGVGDPMGALIEQLKANGADQNQNNISDADQLAISQARAEAEKQWKEEHPNE